MSLDIRIRFGKRLRTPRLKQGWTQVQTAERFGLDRSYFSDVERGKQNISLLNLEIIAKGFGLSLAQLFSRL